jgi:hypothetical protein
MLLLRGWCLLADLGVEASSVETSTNCCIQYKHAFASFVPLFGTFLQKLQFYWM